MPALDVHGGHAQDLPSDTDDCSGRENADFLDMVVGLFPHGYSHIQGCLEFQGDISRRTLFDSKFQPGNKSYEPMPAHAGTESNRLLGALQPQTSTLIRIHLHPITVQQNTPESMRIAA